MAFNVGDIIRKKTKTQKFKVTEVIGTSDVKAQYEPNMSPDVTFEFKQSDIELAV